jgi:Cu/Ag efflux protein CusF
VKFFPAFWLIALALPLAVAGCQDGSEGKKAAEAKEFDVRGKVVAVSPAKPAVTLDHENIPGLMKAMRMEFVVEDPKLLEGIKVGDQVQGRLKQGESGYVLTRLEKR